MKEVHFWRAEDGTDFEYKDDCIIHEFEVRFNALGNDILCMTSDGKIFSEIEDFPDASLLYLGTDEAVNLWKDVNEYEGTSSCGYGCCSPGMYYCDSYSGEWKDLEEDISHLNHLKEKILEIRG